MGADVTLLSSLTLSKAQGQRRRRAREPERQLPGAAGHQQPRRRLRLSALPPAVQQHDQLRLVAAVRHGQALGQRHVAGAGRAGRRLAGRRHQHDHAGRDGDVHLHAGARRSRCRRSPTTSRARTTTARTSPAIRTRAEPAVDHQLVQPGVRRRCRPIRASRSATRRATTSAGRTSGSSTSRRARTSRSATARKLQFRLEAFNLFNRVNFTRAGGNRSAAPSARSRRPTTRGSCSWA